MACFFRAGDSCLLNPSIPGVVSVIAVFIAAAIAFVALGGNSYDQDPPAFDQCGLEFGKD
jgi:hypothetical protein